MKIVKHCSSTFPTTATGSLVGMDNNGVLEITNSFPFPSIEPPSNDSHQNDASSIAAAAPRAKANIAYQNDMIRHLKEVNIDANTVGWYTSAAMGNFINLAFIENQYHYQRDNEKTVALVHDVSRTSAGVLNLRAFKLSAPFMAAYKEGKFTTERYGTNTDHGQTPELTWATMQPTKVQDDVQRYPSRTWRDSAQFTPSHDLPTPNPISTRRTRDSDASFSW
jgi:hypothetical protein